MKCLGGKKAQPQAGATPVLTAADPGQPHDSQVRVLLIGDMNVGKCLAQGTQLLRSDGATVAVERVAVGDMLLGDDARPRRVLALNRGVAPLFRLRPATGPVDDGFTCNADHILVLDPTSASQPILRTLPTHTSVTLWRPSPDGDFTMHGQRSLFIDASAVGNHVDSSALDLDETEHEHTTCELLPDEPGRARLTVSSHLYPNLVAARAAAQRHYSAALCASSAGAAASLWEVSLASFLRLPLSVQRACQLVRMSSFTIPTCSSSSSSSSSMTPPSVPAFVQPRSATASKPSPPLTAGQALLLGLALGSDDVCDTEVAVTDKRTPVVLPLGPSIAPAAVVAHLASLAGASVNSDRTGCLELVLNEPALPLVLNNSSSSRCVAGDLSELAPRLLASPADVRLAALVGLFALLATEWTPALSAITRFVADSLVAPQPQGLSLRPPRIPVDGQCTIRCPTWWSRATACDLQRVARSIGCSVELVDEDGLELRLSWTQAGCNAASTSVPLFSRFEFVVEPLPRGAFYGFALDGNARFVLANLVVSHNSNLILRVTANEFFEADSTAPPRNLDIEKKNISIDGQITQLILTDTGGTERFRTISQNYYRNTDAVIVSFSLADKESFLNCRTIWLREADRYKPDGAEMFLVGTKSDLPREVESHRAQSLADENGITYLETSAKDNVGVTELFATVIKKVRDRHGGVIS